MLNLFLILLINLQTHSFNFTPRQDSILQSGIKQIYNIQFEEAEQTFKQFVKKYPRNPAGRFFYAMVDWWKIMLDLQQTKYDEDFIHRLNVSIDFCDSLLEENSNDVAALFFKGGALGFRGRLYSIRHEFLKAALDAKDAVPLIAKTRKLAPDNKDVELGFGIYNYYAVAIPEEFPFIKPMMIFFPGGDKQKGLEQLKDVALNGHFAKYESMFFVMLVYYQFEKNYDSAFVYAKKLHLLFPNNPVFHKYVGRCIVHQANWIQAGEIFKGVFRKCRMNFAGYNEKTEREAAYYVGNWYKIVGLYDSALVYFRISELLSEKLDARKPTGFLANSLLYLGMIYDALGKRELALEKYKATLKIKDFKGTHKLAQRYLKNPYKK